MKNNTQNISLVVVFAALYAIAVIVLAPISFGVYQVRIADALLPLSMIFGPSSAIGFGLGCIVSNVYGGLGLVDIFGGFVANVVACTLAWYIAKRGGIKFRFLGSIIETVVITAIVGGYLTLIFDVPLEFGILGIFVGSIIAINILGFPIQEAIRRNKTIKQIISTQ